MPFVREEHIDIRQIGDTRFELVTPVRYVGKEQTFVVPAGQSTDLASVPIGLTWLIPRYGRWTKAAILHDYLHKVPGLTKSDVDGIFRRSLRELGVPMYKRWMMWTAVRLYSMVARQGVPGTKVSDVVVMVPSVIFNGILLAIPVTVVYIFKALFGVLNLIFSVFDGKMRREQKDMPL